MQIFSFAVLFSLFPHPLHAGAWLQRPGRTEIIVTTSYYHSDDYFDSHGKQKPQGDYRKIDSIAYLEIGLNYHWTVGASLSGQTASQEDPLTGDRAVNSAYAGDSEFFARRAIWKKGSAIVSAQGLVKVPGFDEPLERPQLVSRYPDAALGIAAGYSGKVANMPAFADAELIYRYRHGPSHDQVQFNSTLGIRPAKRVLLLPQLFATWRTGFTPVPSFIESPRNDYDLLKAQLSAVYQWSENYSLQGGMFYNVSGKNTGQGSGALLGVWRQF